MCTNLIHVRSKNPYNVTYAHVPCGKCDECRKAIQNQWQCRLFAELEEFRVKRGWNVGFITLTYQDKCLPLIPKSFFKKGEYQEIPCFSYEDIRKFTSCIRTYLYRRRKLTDSFRFFITSEYGEQYHRPHYHGILLFNSRISHQEMYQMVEDAWCGTSQIIPQSRRKRDRRKPIGIVASFSSFVPRDNMAVGSYVAKYVCKDISFDSVTSGKFDHLSRKMKNRLRHFMPFHKQSMGFGASLIRGKSDSELLDMYMNGCQFTGQGKRVELPVYIKEKILFTRRRLYNLKSHRFESMKCYTDFFFRHKDEIYAHRFNQSKLLIQRLAAEDKSNWYRASIIGDDFYYAVRDLVEEVGLEELAGFDTLYYGVKCNRCHLFEFPAEGYFARYNPVADLTSLPLLDKDYHAAMTAALDVIHSCQFEQDPEVRSAEQEVIARVRAFFNSRR